MLVDDYRWYVTDTSATPDLTAIQRILSQLLWCRLARQAGDRTADCDVPVALSYDERENAHCV
jgi:hypothetical protein